MAKICDNAYYHGCYYPPAADESRPSAYSMLYTRDFEYTMEFLHDVFDAEGWATAYNESLYIIDKEGPAPGGVADESIFRAKILANLALYYPAASHGGAGAGDNSALFCDRVVKVFAGLDQVYADPNSFRDNLVFSAAPISGYGFTDSIPKSGRSKTSTLATKNLLETTDGVL